MEKNYAQQINAAFAYSEEVGKKGNFREASFLELCGGFL